MHKSRRSFPAIALIAALSTPFLVNCSRSLLPVSYRPSSPEIEQLALDTTMTPKAQQLFYQQDPKIQSKAEFRSQCRKPGQDPEKTIILGCFTSNGYTGSIVIQSVTDPRLDGTMEVVAAHEMLHAAYQDLDAQTRSRLKPQLKQAAKRVTDPNLASVLDAYAAGDPKIYYNELHSHLGTELADLGNPDLEQHYRQYFSDRQQVVALAQQSRRQLKELEAQADQLKAEIDALEQRLQTDEQAIKRNTNTLDAQFNTIEQMKSELRTLRQETETLARQGDRSLVNSFNQTKDRFNAEVREYNAQVERHRAQVAEYNQKVTLYKQKVSEYNQLAQTRGSILDSLKGEPSDFSVPQISP